MTESASPQTESPSDPPSSDVPVIRNVTFAYNESEDRILLHCVTAFETRLTMALTRRLVRSLVRGFGQVLERSSIVAARAPSEYRDDILAFEHLGAVEKCTQAQTTVEPAPVDPDAVPGQCLLVRVDVTPQPGGRFRLIFHDPQAPRVGAMMGREELHTLLDGLGRYARKAEWDLQADIGWLEQQPTVGSTAPIARA